MTCLSLPVVSAETKPNLILPKPSSTELKQGTFTLTADTLIVAPAALENEAKALRDALAPATGMKLSIQQNRTDKPQVMLALDPSLKSLGPEGYSLQVVSKGALIKSSTPAGVYYGVQSLLQLLPDEIVSRNKVEADWSLPCVQVQDQPRFAWRAFMLDEARHFKGEKEVKKLLDQMAALKMNVFHWHLTDDQGWRIEIKKYPKLTTIGSKRTDTQTGGWGSSKRSGEPHEGFYTQEQIKDIVAYAKARHITVVPEIGMPGHACAAIASYPELGTNKKPIEVMTVFGKALDVYDPSSEFVYTFLSDVLDEVIELFPSRIVHIGGDEVKFEQWQSSKAIKELMKREKLKTMADVQLYFTNRMADIVQKKGRNIMGWNEILGDDLHGFLKGGQTAKAAKLDKDTVVHFWKGSPKLAKRAVVDGHTIVNSLHSYTYLDYGYGSISLGKAYGFNPILNGLSPEEEKRIIGLGCQMWGEWIPTVERMEFQIYPRLAAYAEVGWTQLENKDFDAFKQTMDGQLKRWDIQGIGYAKDQVAKLSAQDFFNHVKVDGWNPAKTPADWKELEFSTEGKITAAGQYEVVFLYQKGTHALDISEVSLLEDGKPVAKDKHEAFSGGQLKGIVYKLKLPEFKQGAKYTVRARIKGNGGTDSHGEVKIRAGE
ncbi:beta-N-acetylhexosaminidase [Oceaniferula marina]|nr:beta-N-acetylhexosaminidase [Oceaniferula marina]